MTNVRTDYVAAIALGIAIGAVIMNIWFEVDEPDMTDFVSISQYQDVLDRVTELEEHAVNHEHDLTEFAAGLDEQYVTYEFTSTLVSNMADIVDTTIQLQEEVIKNRDDIRDNHPFNFEPEEISIEERAVAPESLLTIGLEKSKWLRGETVVITGKGVGFAGQVQGTVTEPNGNERYLNAVTKNTGEYQINFGTDFNSQLGNYTVYVEQKDRMSKSISFILGE